jgi:hypothetical protein
VNFNFQPPAMFFFYFLFFRKSGLIKSSSFFEDLSAYTISCSYVEWCKFCFHLSSLKIPPSPLKTIPVKLVGTSMIFYCTKPRLSKCNGLLVISMKQNINLYFNPSHSRIFFISSKSGLVKSSSSEDLSEYKMSLS